jgi:RNA polymerase sigma-70 factor (ECF subfamily)
MAHFSENKQKSRRARDWKAACFSVVVPRGRRNMQAIEEVGREPQMDFSIRETGISEMQDVVTRYLPRFHRNAYRHLGNAADAEDAVQDAMLAAYVHLDQFRGQAQMSTWLTSIVTNCARMHLRRQPRRPHVSLDESRGEDQEYSLADRLADSRANPEDDCRNAELRGHIVQAVAQLSPSLQRTYQLCGLNGLSLKEAAHTLGVAEGTVKAQMSRARAKLTRLLRRTLRLDRRSVKARGPQPVLSRRIEV